MNWRLKLADLLTKGQFSTLSKENSELKTPRPGLGIYEAQGTAVANSLMGFAYFLEAEVGIFSDIVLTLKREIFRRGFYWKPKFACKCTLCGNEYEEERELCDCGCADLKKPDKSQLQWFTKIEKNGRTFVEEANDNGMSLKEVLSEFEFHLEVGDNGYLICRKSYVFTSEGAIFTGIPREFLSVDPRTIEKIVDQQTGEPGANIWVCPVHRDEIVDNPEPNKLYVCKKCKKPLVLAKYRTTLGTKKTYYIDGEVCYTAKYYPTILYGFPPILKVIDEALTYHHMEKRERRYFERGRPPGIMVVPTSNQESLRKFWKETQEELKKDYYYFPILGYDSIGKAVAEFIKLMDDPSDQMLKIKDEIRERIGSRFGVSLIFQADTSTSGGLNNEGLQITVTNRAVEDGQSLYNDKVLPWITNLFGITDFILQLNPNEEKDEMAEKQRLAQDIANARGMLDMGFDVIYEHGEFKFSGQAKRREPGPGFPGQPEMPAADDRRAGGEPESYTEMRRGSVEKYEPDEFDGYNSDVLIKEYAADALQAIQAGALYPYYKDVPLVVVPVIHDIIKQAFLSGRLSLRDMISAITARTGLDYDKARLIARTESTNVVNMARKIGWERMEQNRGEQFLYKWSVHHDDRTSPQCIEIEQRVGEGKPLYELQRILQDVAQKYIPGWNAAMVPHPHCRSTLVRKVQL